LTIHCTPVEESERSSCRLGTAIATIVMSMKVIETAKIIAAKISLLFLAPTAAPMRVALLWAAGILPVPGEQLAPLPALRARHSG
jgi:hypothetical protein